MKHLLLSILSFLLFSCGENAHYVGASENVSLETRTVLPDISPEHAAGSVSYSQGQTKTVAVRIRNFGGPTTAPVEFYVQKMQPAFNIAFDSTATAATIGITTYVLDNPKWNVVEQATRFKFSLKVPFILTTQQVIGLQFTAGTNGGANWTTTVIAGTGGGETPTTNNVKITVGLNII